MIDPRHARFMLGFLLGTLIECATESCDETAWTLQGFGSTKIYGGDDDTDY